MLNFQKCDRDSIRRFQSMVLPDLEHIIKVVKVPPSGTDEVSGLMIEVMVPYFVGEIHSFPLFVFY